MKISDILQQQNIPGSGKSTGPGSSADFAAILQSHLQGAGNTEPATGVQQTTASSGPVPAHLRLESLEVSQNTIATLEAFSNALSNPAVQSEELEPYINALENEVAAMLELKGELPAQDPLARILEEVAAVSYLETAKYRRGDYH
ncbi:hypothetical protein [Desulfurivibrio alkaliphilus]|uniref:Uncharacterized protein n=1 Tax=Desulfurivibrio alkaliphilus (strain DSM 19089 / UNIQEM U267 / AHT2) TaxID=589865 RepID=D6Z0V0_DESAT|nr:hypothetical protein [Desulfurivibrio alkaliphilus]ADH87210.1 hypothetical protein DaAHT2_2546 [Desulfurivibrio alkaliphilus AHT 2]